MLDAIKYVCIYVCMYFGENSPYNTTFRTTGDQSVFNAEAQAIECALFSSTLQIQQ